MQFVKKFGLFVLFTVGALILINNVSFLRDLSSKRFGAAA